MEPFVAGPRRLPRAHRAGGLARGPGQGVRRRRHRRGLLPRGVRLPRRRDPRPGARACSTTPGTPSSPSTGCGRRSRPTRGSPAGSRCGAAGWSARRSARPSGSRPSGTRSRRCSSAGCRTAGRRPRRGRPDVRPAHREPHRAGWPTPRPVRPEPPATARRSRPGGSRARRSRRRRACPTGRRPGGRARR